MVSKSRTNSVTNHLLKKKKITFLLWNIYFSRLPSLPKNITSPTVTIVFHGFSSIHLSRLKSHSLSVSPFFSLKSLLPSNSNQLGQVAPDSTWPWPSWGFKILHTPATGLLDKEKERERVGVSSLKSILCFPPSRQPLELINWHLGYAKQTQLSPPASIPNTTTLEIYKAKFTRLHVDTNNKFLFAELHLINWIYHKMPHGIRKDITKHM